MGEGEGGVTLQGGGHIGAVSMWGEEEGGEFVTGADQAAYYGDSHQVFFFKLRVFFYFFYLRGIRRVIWR